MYLNSIFVNSVKSFSIHSKQMAINARNLVLFILFILFGMVLSGCTHTMLKKYAISVPVSLLYLVGIVLLYVYLPANRPCKCPQASDQKKALMARRRM